MAEDATQPGGAVALAADEEVPQRNGEAALGQRNANSTDAPVVVRRYTTAVDMRAWADASALAAALAAPTQDAGSVARFEQAATGAKKLISKTASVSLQKVVLPGLIDGKPGFILRSKEVVAVSHGGPPLAYWERAGGRSAVPKEQHACIRLEMVCVLKDGKVRWLLVTSDDPNGCSNSCDIGRRIMVARAPRRAVRRAVGPARRPRPRPPSQ